MSLLSSDIEKLLEQCKSNELELYKVNQLYKDSQMELTEKERELESCNGTNDEIKEKLEHCANEQKHKLNLCAEKEEGDWQSIVKLFK